MGGWHLNVCSHARIQLLVNNAAVGKLVSTEPCLCRSISGAAYGENKQALEKVLERKFLQPQSCTYNLIFVFWKHCTDRCNSYNSTSSSSNT